MEEGRALQHQHGVHHGVEPPQGLIIVHVPCMSSMAAVEGAVLGAAIWTMLLLLLPMMMMMMMVMADTVIDSAPPLRMNWWRGGATLTPLSTVLPC